MGQVTPASCRDRRLERNVFIGRNDLGVERVFCGFNKRGRTRCSDVAVYSVKRPGEHAGSRKVLGVLYARTGRPEEALREFRAATRIDPQDADTRRRIEALAGKPTD